MGSCSSCPATLAESSTSPTVSRPSLITPRYTVTVTVVCESFGDSDSEDDSVSDSADNRDSDSYREYKQVCSVRRKV